MWRVASSYRCCLLTGLFLSVFTAIQAFFVSKSLTAFTLKYKGKKTPEEFSFIIACDNLPSQQFLDMIVMQAVQGNSIMYLKILHE